jgi:transcriptional regulator with XRE-family HTH domain
VSLDRQDTFVTSRRNLVLDTHLESRRVEIELGREIRDSRISAGTSQRVAAARVAMSHAQLGRIERGELDHLTIDQAARSCAAVGLKLIVRAVPGGDPALDAGQLALLERFRRELPPALAMRTEVPLPIPGDRRAWDGFIVVDGVGVGVEAEARIRDAQAVDRRCALKKRDGGVNVVILLIADTESNRRMLALHREALRSSFPLDARQIMAALRVGRPPSGSGIVVR